MPDIFNRMTYAQAIKSKKMAEMKKCLTKLFTESGTFAKVYSDGEFEYLKEFFQEKNMKLITKPKGQHVNLAEAKISQVKRRLHAAMRAKHTSNWKKFLTKIIKNINKSATHAIGNLRPIGEHLPKKSKFNSIWNS